MEESVAILAQSRADRRHVSLHSELRVLHMSRTTPFTHFAQAAHSLVTLGTELVHGSRTAPNDLIFQKRTADFNKSAALQRALETQFGISHLRSLKTSLDIAAERQLFCPRALRRLEEVIHSGNAARHQRWLRPPGRPGVAAQVSADAGHSPAPRGQAQTPVPATLPAPASWAILTGGTGVHPRSPRQGGGAAFRARGRAPDGG